MAKRITDTFKWKNRFFRELLPEYKLLWYYIWDDCDHAGIWDIDFETASRKIGFDYTEEQAMEEFGGEIIPFDGNRWFVPCFLELQYGMTLNSKDNKCHKSVVQILDKFKLREYIYVTIKDS